ncbi:MAG: ADP-glyceromanno-heptose 6-epimerase [Bacteroidia bacterium]|nr:ADP-glyceromanno-heptose 6-epimerase [Bacteroidia bacterium]
MIVVTGAAGFIGSALLAALNERRYYDLVPCDDFLRPDKSPNFCDKKYAVLVDRTRLLEFLADKPNDVQAVVHLGARTDTTVQDPEPFRRLNVEFSKALFSFCAQWQIPFLYASSAATYGAGEHGFDDAPELLPHLQPLNAYARSKHEFDLWVAAQSDRPYYWMGFKFFNVYGPNEYHKGRMASVVFHAVNQIENTGRLRLFMSHRADYAHGEQARDFVYVKDVVRTLIYFLENRDPRRNGIYNLGTGEARTFNDLAAAVFSALGREKNVEYIPIPEDIRDGYQYYTRARMERLRAAGYVAPFVSLEEGVADYLSRYRVEGTWKTW